MAMPTIAAFQTAVEDIVADGEIWHDITHGPATGPTSEVTTENGPVRTLAKAIADISLSESSSAAIEGRVEDLEDSVPGLNAFGSNATPLA